jgi:hypothetical protein
MVNILASWQFDPKWGDVAEGETESKLQFYCTMTPGRFPLHINGNLSGIPMR